MVESWAVTERVQDETGTSYCAKKVRKLSKNDGDISKGHRS